MATKDNDESTAKTEKSSDKPINNKSKVNEEKKVEENDIKNENKDDNKDEYYDELAYIDALQQVSIARITDWTHYKNWKVVEDDTDKYVENYSYFYIQRPSSSNILFRLSSDYNFEALNLHEIMFSTDTETIKSAKWRQFYDFGELLPGFEPVTHKLLYSSSSKSLYSIATSVSMKNFQGRDRGIVHRLSGWGNSKRSRINTASIFCERIDDDQWQIPLRHTSYCIHSEQYKGDMIFSFGGGAIPDQFASTTSSYFLCQSGQQKDIKPFKVARYECGAHYDEKRDVIYLGGGRGRIKFEKDKYDENKKGVISHAMEYFDINKDKWYNLPPTRMQHGNNPLIWCRNDNLLCIASICEYSNALECIDLRENKRNWKVVYFDQGKSDSRSLSNVFGVEIPTLPKEVDHVTLC